MKTGTAVILSALLGAGYLASQMFGPHPTPLPAIGQYVHVAISSSGRSKASGRVAAISWRRRVKLFQEHSSQPGSGYVYWVDWARVTSWQTHHKP